MSRPLAGCSLAGWSGADTANPVGAALALVVRRMMARRFVFINVFLPSHTIVKDSHEAAITFVKLS